VPNRRPSHFLRATARTVEENENIADLSYGSRWVLSGIITLATPVVVTGTSAPAAVAGWPWGHPRLTCRAPR
jgi:hypothetical protein